MKHKLPESPENWQLAVDLAEFYLGVESARMYGLAAGGPKVNVIRCQAVLKEGTKRGYRPRPMAELAKDFVPMMLEES